MDIVQKIADAVIADYGFCARRVTLEAAIRQALGDGEAVAWVRRHPDGTLTREFLADDAIEPVRKNGSAWVPLYAHPLPAAGGVEPAAAYDAGFRRASDWARRDDLLHDMESTAYVRDREHDFAMMGHPAPARDVPDDVAASMKFYAVDDLIALARIQSEHVARLQKKLPPMRDESPLNPRAGGE